MARNLNYNASGSKCYNNDPANCATYGRLYNWATANTICPSGWHLPNNAEWTTLKNFVGSNAGTKLKSMNGWNNNGNGTDAHGFSALPGGFGDSSDNYLNEADDLGNLGIWWSINEYSNNAYCWFMRSLSEDVSFGNDGNKNYLFSVRCVQD
jgi:uncharacterized protein (TIGR02145 family)